MIETVNDLILALQNFDPNRRVAIRLSSKDGYFSDHKLHQPCELYPGDAVYLSCREALDLESEQGKIS